MGIRIELLILWILCWHGFAGMLSADRRLQSVFMPFIMVFRIGIASLPSSGQFSKRR